MNLEAGQVLTVADDTGPLVRVHEDGSVSINASVIESVEDLPEPDRDDGADAEAPEFEPADSDDGG